MQCAHLKNMFCFTNYDISKPKMVILGHFSVVSCSGWAFYGSGGRDDLIFTSQPFETDTDVEKKFFSSAAPREVPQTDQEMGVHIQRIYSCLGWMGVFSFLVSLREWNSVPEAPFTPRKQLSTVMSVPILIFLRVVFSLNAFLLIDNN